MIDKERREIHEDGCPALFGFGKSICHSPIVGGSQQIEKPYVDQPGKMLDVAYFLGHRIAEPVLSLKYQQTVHYRVIKTTGLALLDSV